MKRQILFSGLLFFSAVRSMDEPIQKPVRKNKPLSLFSGKNLHDIWQMDHDDCLFGQRLPRELEHNIVHYLMALNNPRSFSTSPDQFWRKLLRCCISSEVKEKEWKLPIYLDMTCDEKYYLEKSAGILNIYDVKTKVCIKSIEKMNLVGVCKQDHCIILHERVENMFNFFIYNIAKDRWYELGQGYSWSAYHDKYLAFFDNKYLYILCIDDLDAIRCYRIFCAFRNRWAEFTSDGYIAIVDNCLLRLLTIENEKLKELARYNSDKLLTHYLPCVMRHNDDEYIVCGQQFNYASLGIKIEKRGNGIVALKEMFCLPFNVCSIVDKETLLVSHSNPFFSAIMDYSGKIIEPNKVIHIGHSMIKKDHIFYAKKIEPVLVSAIARVVFDDCGLGMHLEEKIIEGRDSFAYGYVFNNQNTLFVARFDIKKEEYSCSDFNANILTSVKARKVAFRPKGNALLCEREDGTRVKYTLYPNGADEYLKKIASGPLTVCQYIGLEEICKQAEKRSPKCFES